VPTAPDPLDEFRALAASYPRCVWLDGGGGREWSGRRSLLAGLSDDDVSLTYDASTREVRRWVGAPGRWRSQVVGDDVFAVLERELADAPGAQWFGYLGYAARSDLPALVDPDDPLPTAVWMRPSRVRVVEHPPAAAAPAPSGESDDTGPVPASYAEAFARVQEALHAGDSYEVNLTYRRTVTSDRPPAEVYARLRAASPAPYAGFLQHAVDDGTGRAPAWLLSASPERYARIEPGQTSGTRTLMAKPMKGTTPRGATPADDEALRRALVEDPKIRAENLMIVDLLRNDVGAVSRAGTVRVPTLMTTESYAAVHQLVSVVTGELRADVGTVEALRTLFPAGSMTGAPKLRTMEVVAAVEATPRGAYAGAFGWISGDGRADLGVVIRSLTSPDGRTWTVGTGGGITVRSDLADEHAESRWKVERLLRAL